MGSRNFWHHPVVTGFPPPLLVSIDHLRLPSQSYMIAYFERPISSILRVPMTNADYWDGVWSLPIIWVLPPFILLHKLILPHLLNSF